MLRFVQLRSRDRDWLNRDVYAIHLDDLRWPERIPSSAGHFALSLAIDASDASDEYVAAFAQSAIAAGMVSCAAWGVDCKRIHDLIDAATVKLLEPKQPRLPIWDFTVMTTWHDDEPLDEVLWFCDHCPVVDEYFESSCRTWLIMTVGKPEFAEVVKDYFEDN